MIDRLEAELRAALAQRAHEVPADARARVRRIDYRPRSRALNPRMALAAGAGLAATGGTVVALVGLGTNASPAFAGWRATPTPATSGQTVSAQERCASQLASAGGSGIPKQGWQPVLTDTRGPFTVMILRGASASATCFNGPAFTTIAANASQGTASQHVLSGSASAKAGSGSPASPPAVMGLGGGPASGPISLASQAHLTISAGQPYTFVQGQTVAGVTGVTLARSGAGDVRATVADGSFVAWWPGNADATSAQVTSASGVMTQTLTFIAPPAPQLPTPTLGAG